MYSSQMRNLQIIFALMLIGIFNSFDSQGQEPNSTSEPELPQSFDYDCTDADIQIRNYQQASTYDIRLDDMGILDSLLGMRAVKTPTLNALKTSTWFQWGQLIKVYKRVVPVASEIWYEVGPASGSTPTGWIPASYGSTYFIGSVTDPCFGFVPVLQNYQFLEFKYNPEKAATYAVYNAYRNSLALPPAGRVSKRRPLDPLPQFANFAYNMAGGTPSAVFVSEAFWMGGLPMTTGASDSCLQVPNHFISDTYGWRYCGYNESMSVPWDFHEALNEYFTYYTGLLPSVNTPSAVPSNEFYPADKGEQIYIDFPALELSSEDLNDYLVLASGTWQTNKNASDLVNFMPIFLKTKLSAGDYVWINSYNGASGDYHGLIVVGWAKAETCPDALARITNGNWITYEAGNLYRTYTQAYNSPTVPKNAHGNAKVVPWIADFNGLQRPAPRPFYCTRVLNDQVTPPGYFNPHDWWFFQMPEFVHYTMNEVYTNPGWNWTIFSGN